MGRYLSLRFFMTAFLIASLGMLTSCGGGGGGGGAAPGGPTAPSAFGLLTPVDNASNVAIVPSLSWVDSTGETSYTLQISSSPAFTSPLIFEKTDVAANTTSFNVPPGILRINTKYYWRLLAVNAQGSTGSATFSFTTKNTPPDLFNLVTPADTTQDVSLTPTLTWVDAIGASFYTVETSTDAGFVSSTVSSVTPTNTSFGVPSALQEWTTYYWRVAAVNSAGTTTAANAPFSFKTKKNGAPDAFDLTAPAYNTIGASLTPDLTWNTANGVTTYTVQIATDPTFTTGLLTYPNRPASTNHYTVPSGDLSETTIYYWRVIANNASGSTNSNQTFKFTTKRVSAPSAFTLLSPANAAPGVLFPVTLAWNASAGEDSYTVQISIDNFVTSLNTATIPAGSTSYTLAPGILNAGTTYSWRVIAVNTIGSTTATNAPFSFITKSSGDIVWSLMNDPSTIDDQAYGMAIDSTYMYVVGFDSAAGDFDWGWRIEKRDLVTGASMTSFGPGGAISENIGVGSGLDDAANAVAVDSNPTGTMMYIVGYESTVLQGTEWRIEARNKATGTLISSVTSSLSTGDDYANAIAIDPGEGYMYVVGSDYSAGNSAWRIEKRSLAAPLSLEIVTFGTPSTPGYIYSNPSTTGADAPLAIAIDSTYLYIAGYDTANGSRRWRIEKRSRTDGSLETTSFGPGGYVNSNTATSAAANAIAIDSSYIYVAGYDNSVSGHIEWRIEKRDITTGALVATFGTGGVVVNDFSLPTLDHDIWTIAVDTNYVYVAGYESVDAVNNRWRIQKLVK